MAGLMDLFGGQQGEGQYPGISGIQNSLVGLGLGLMSGPTLADALKGYTAGAHTDAQNAHVRQQAREAQLNRQMHHEQMAQSASQFNQSFGLQQRAADRADAPQIQLFEDDFGFKKPMVVDRFAPGGPRITPAQMPGAPSGPSTASSAPAPNFGPVPYAGGGPLGTSPAGPSNQAYASESPQFAEPQPQPQQGWPASPYGGPSAAPASAMPPGIDATVKGILEGRMAPPSSFAASKPYWQRILALAAQQDPAFDLTEWGKRYQTAKDFGSGAAAKNITAMNTVMGHLDTLREKADALNNTSFPMANTAINAVQNQMGDPRQKEFNLARNAVADELARVFRQSGMSDTEIRRWQDTLESSNSPDQMRGSIRTGLDLINSRMESMRDQYRRGMGREPPEILSPKAQQTLENVSKWAGGDNSAYKAEPSAPQQAGPAAPKVGTLSKGYRFKGGDPADPGNWIKVKD